MHSQIPSGPIGGRVGGVRRSLGGTPATAGYEAAASSVAVKVAAAMGLKPLSEAEVAEVRNQWLPAPNDTPKQAKAKIDALKTMIMANEGGVPTSPAGMLGQ